MSQTELSDSRGIASAPGNADGHVSTLALTFHRAALWLQSPRPYLMFIGFSLFLGFWYLAVEVWKLPRFAEMPGLTDGGLGMAQQKSDVRPVDFHGGILPPYMGQHAPHRDRFLSCYCNRRSARLCSSAGQNASSSTYFQYSNCSGPSRPLAWVPLAIVMFQGSETPVIFLTFLASFYATALNTMLGVESIDVSYIRAASCLGAKRWQVFRHVIVPGALPFIFTGLQISVGVAWFSLVAGEMVSGQYGLGYVINTSYTMVRYPTIIIGMVTLGIVGYVTSAAIRNARRLHDAMAHPRACAGGRAVTTQPAYTSSSASVAGVATPIARKGGVRIKDVVKRYGTQDAGVLAVDHCTFDVPAGEITVVVGPSGCGKTTLLNAIAGFHSLTSGTIYLDNEMLCGPGKLKAEPGPDRIVVFQNGALFPWKTNIENVAFGPIMQGS